MNLADTSNPEALRSAESIYLAWDEALGHKDIEAAMALYAADAVLESPLVRHLLGENEGVVRGRENLRRFVEVVFERQSPLRQRYRKGFFTDGTTLMWEYPRTAASGEQLDLVEVMTLADGLIRRHSVYWGWLAVKVLEEDRYRST